MTRPLAQIAVAEAFATIAQEKLLPTITLSDTLLPIVLGRLQSSVADEVCLVGRGFTRRHCMDMPSPCRVTGNMVASGWPAL